MTEKGELSDVRIPVSNSTIGAMAGRAVECFRRFLFKDAEADLSMDSIGFWQYRIFSTLSLGLVFLCGPLLVYGAYLFYSDGAVISALFEFMVYVGICIVLSLRSLRLDMKKFLIILLLYSLSIQLLIFTGETGAGMVCVAFAMILSVCLLNKRKNILFMVINLSSFTALTLLLELGYLDGLPIAEYGDLWYINALTTQICGMIMAYVIYMIHARLEHQTNKIKESKELLMVSELKHKAMIANISDVIVIADPQGHLLYSSANMLQRLGWKHEDFLETEFWAKVQPEDQGRVREHIASLLEKDAGTVIFEAPFLSGNGEVRHLEITAINMLHDPHIEGILINNHDITEGKLKDEKVQYMFYHDSLTGLYNRGYLDRYLKVVDKESNLPLSVIAVDINGLKIINDSFGYQKGDSLLVTLSEILRKCHNTEDTVFRVGGDEFLLLMPNASVETAEAMLEEIYSACETFNSTGPESLYQLSVSMGTATKEHPQDHIEHTVKQAEDWMNRRKLLEEKSLHNSILTSIQKALFEKSQETEEHANRLATLSRSIGLVLGLSRRQLDELELLAKLHDIGKIGIDDKILNKEDALTEDEWTTMKKHSEIGYRIAQASQDLKPIGEYILSHHERWDGTGYPLGLQGEDISQLSRILSVVDSYDAMTQDRAYRKAMSREEAIVEILRNSGTQFDPEIVRIFMDVLKES